MLLIAGQLGEEVLLGVADAERAVAVRLASNPGDGLEKKERRPMSGPTSMPSGLGMACRPSCKLVAN